MRERLAVEAERQQGEVVVGELGRQVGDPERAALLERGDGRRPTRAVRRRGRAGRAAGRRSTRRARSSPRRTRSAGRPSAASSPAGPRGTADADRSAYTISRRYAGSVAVGRDPGRAGALVDRHALRPVAGPRAEHRHLAQPRHGPAGGEQHGGDRGDARRPDEPAPRQPVAVGGSPSSAWSSARASRTTGSLTAMCTTSAPIATQADGEVGRPEGEGPRVPGRHVGQPGRELEDRGRDEHADRGPLGAAQQQVATWPRRPDPEARVDRPELDEQQRHARGAGGDVQALGEAVPPDRPAREPAVGLLREVAEQPGGESDEEADAQPGPDPRGDARGGAAARGSRAARATRGAFTVVMPRVSCSTPTQRSPTSRVSTAKPAVGGRAPRSRRRRPPTTGTAPRSGRRR